MSTIKSSAEDLTLNADGSGNDVIIQSNASTKAIVTAEGNVGIGTTSPTYPLHIKSSATTTANFDAGSDGYDVQLRFEQNGTFVGAVGFDDSKDVVYLNRYGNATKGLTVDSSGDVTIPNATGASFILSREDTSNQTGDLIGAIGFRNTDVSGDEPNYCGIKAKVSGGAGSDGELEFYTARNNYEADSGAAVIIRDTGVMELAINHLKFGTVGKGIDFSANTALAGSDSQILNDYEEGTFTAVVTMGSGTATVYTNYNTLSYVKIGNLVTIGGQFRIETVTAASGTFTLNLPFSVAASTEGAGLHVGNFRTHLTDIPTDAVSPVIYGHSTGAALVWNQDYAAAVQAIATTNGYYMIGLTYRTT